jgi:hypothetical protein
MAAPSDPRLNQLLAALPETEWQRWQPLLEWVELPLGHVMPSRWLRWSLTRK